MVTPRNLVPIYTTKGDLGAFMLYPYLYNVQGEWIGWVAANRMVYSVHGDYVGWLSEDPRILRRRAGNQGEERCAPPPPAPPIRLPIRVPLPPLMPELAFGVIDVLGEAPDLLPCLDFGELRQDLD